ncbi:MAG TPA: phage head closure protein [Rhizomicrobium sp.]|nr:phage head closure protein [Rhizomicrobium sp.]
MFGTLNQRATILARDDAPDGGGGSAESWSATGRVWARLDALSADDAFGPDARESRVRYRVTARRNGLIAAGLRLAIASRTFLIHAVMDDGPPSQLVTLLCEEIP